MKLLSKSLFFIFLAFQVNAQFFLIDQIDPSRTGAFFRGGNTLEKNVVGSPYVIPAYLPGKVNGFKQTVPLRYNAYTDEIEYKHDTETEYVLPKKEDMSPISIQDKTYLLYDYVDNANEKINGYLVEKHRNKYVLLLREHIKYKEGKDAIGSYDVERPPSFQKQKEVYYYFNNNKVLTMPTSKKELLAAFPNKKNEINAFLKSNKINFSKEEDLKVLLGLLETL